jgi:hypothetical protein
VEKSHPAPLAKIEPAARVEIGGGTRGEGAVPARSAARNGDTDAVVEADCIAGVDDVVDAMETEAVDAGRAATADAGQEAPDDAAEVASVLEAEGTEVMAAGEAAAADAVERAAEVIGSD